MFHFLSQKRLQSRGFSSGQKRRKLSDTAWTEIAALARRAGIADTDIDATVRRTA